MDKVMKAEIREIVRLAIKTKEQELATNALTTLIIKWLESKKIDILDHHEKYHKDCHRCIEIFACNQLITELIGGLR